MLQQLFKAKETKDKEFILDLVKFCILMENNGGIREKSPKYIMEKFQRAIAGSRGMLDNMNELKFMEYVESWYSGQVA